MIRIIVCNKENSVSYTIPIFEELFDIGGLNDLVKEMLLISDKELKKIWRKGTQLLANVYIDNKYIGHLNFEL